MYSVRYLFLPFCLISFIIDELFIWLCTSVLYFFNYVCVFVYLVGVLSLCIYLFLRGICLFRYLFLYVLWVRCW